MLSGAPSLVFGPAQRLLKSSEFSRVFKQGRRLNVLEFTLAYRIRAPREGRVYPARLGLSVSRKVGGAVQRNLIKRRLREIFRLNQLKLAPGCELVVIPRKEVMDLGYFELESRLFSLLERGKLLIKAS